MAKKLRFTSVLTNDVKINKFLKFDLSQFSGIPKKGLLFEGVSKAPFKQYDDNGVVPGSEDPSRTVKLTFKAYDLKKVKDLDAQLKAGEIDDDDYEDAMASYPVFDIEINDEQSCNEFLNLYGSMVEDLQDGQDFESENARIAITPKWVKGYKGNGSWSQLNVKFDDIENMKFKKHVTPTAPKS